MTSSNSTAVATEEGKAGTGLARAGEKNRAARSNEDTFAYLDGWVLWSLAMALMSSGFMLSLDNTILATAIPRITNDFNSLNDIGWYAAVYQITKMALLPTCGRIYTFYDVRWSYISLLLVLELGSVISALAQNSMMLIIGRAVSGVGAAGLMSGAAIIVSSCVGLKRRPILMGLLSLVYGVGSVMGPLIGGVITDTATLTWRFCFWVNLPFGAIGLVQVWFALRNPPPAADAGLSSRQKLRQLDLPGATILIGSIACLLLALQWGGIAYPWASAKVYGCLIGFGLLLIVFLVMQAKDRNSCTIPLRLLRNRTVCVASGFMLCLQLAMVVQTYYWPLYFQSVKGASAKDSGIYILPLCISSAVSTLGAGWIISKCNHYVPFMWLGAPILAAGAGLFRIVGVDSPAARWIGVQIVSGFGYGICGQVPVLSVQVALDKGDVPTGCVIVIFFQSLGAALATSMAQNIFADTLLKDLRGITGVSGPAVFAAGATEFRRLVPPEMLPRVVDAFQDALRSVFVLALVSASVSLVISIAMERRRLATETEDG